MLDVPMQDISVKLSFKARMSSVFHLRLVTQCSDNCLNLLYIGLQPEVEEAEVEREEEEKEEEE